MKEIYIGRSEKDVKKWGDVGTAMLGKHYVTTGGEVNLSNKVHLDLVKPHVMFICGKRGTGKSYTMGTIAEGIQLLPRKVKDNLACVIVDIMGIYWTMRYPNEREADIVRMWDLDPTGIDVNVMVPLGWVDKFKEMNIPFDAPFSFIPGELTANDWCNTFGLELFGKYGVIIERIVKTLKNEFVTDFGIDEIIDTIRNDKKSDVAIKEALENRFSAADDWGIFSKDGTAIADIAARGKVNVLDTSTLEAAIGGFSTKALVIGLVALKILEARMLTRKVEEHAGVESSQSMFGGEDSAALAKKMIPMTWLIIDEAHQALPHPSEGVTPASVPLIRILREGRQPGVTLVAATQQPGKIHTDVHSQTDLLLSHRVTAQPDVNSLNSIMGSYMSKSLEGYIHALPKEVGSALMLDDANEKVYAIRTRPRLSWHAGEGACALQLAKDEVL